MAIHWQIKFKSLRAGTDYTVNIYDSTFSGTPIVLKGGAQPFTTQESSDDDMFIPVRTQTGYLRIVDDGKDADGNAWNWKTLLPSTDTDRPVTLTDGNGTIVWQGFMQAQNFGGVLYGNPQEREFPVQCCLSVLSAIKVSTAINELKNFAFLVDHMLTQIPTHSFTQVVVQGGSDAQTWLLKKFDWQNFLNSDDDQAESDYDLGQVLEDFARFWGWTARTMGQTLYLTCAEDPDEQSILTLTRAQLTTMAGGTSAGTVTSGLPTATLTGDIFASINNDDYTNRGPQRATVKVNANKEDVVFKCFPKSVEDYLDGLGYGSWVQGEADMTGYFSTPAVSSFDSKSLTGTATAQAGFCRRQIYSSTDATAPTICDMIKITAYPTTTPYVQLRTKKAMTLSGGSIELKASIYKGEKTWQSEFGLSMIMQLGISPTTNRSDAKWWHLYTEFITIDNQPIRHEWTTTPHTFMAGFQGNQMQSSTVYNLGIGAAYQLNFPRIPIADGLNGFIFIDIFGIEDNAHPSGDDPRHAEPFEISNFEIEFTRDKTVLPSRIDQVRPRELVASRTDIKEYKASNNNQTQGEWNADCIFASDNNLAYGYGLLLNPDGTYMETAPYNGTNEHPEQHLADRVVAYWEQAKRRIGTELRSDVIPAIGPAHKLTMDATTFSPIAISHDWHNDITQLTVLEI